MRSFIACPLFYAICLFPSGYNAICTLDILCLIHPASLWLFTFNLTFLLHVVLGLNKSNWRRIQTDSLIQIFILAPMVTSILDGPWKAFIMYVVN